MIKELSAYLVQNGYRIIPTNVSQICFFGQIEMQSVNMIILVECTNGFEIDKESLAQLKNMNQSIFAQKGITEIHTMSVFLGDDSITIRECMENDPFVWRIGLRDAGLYIYEHQVPDFYGIKRVLEGFLEEYISKPQELSREYEQLRAAQGQQRAQVVAGRAVPDHVVRKWPWCSITLVFLNVLFFFVCTWGSKVLYNQGVLVGNLVVEEKQYYRIFTSMFLHANVEHLFGNMIALCALGALLEREYGKVRFLLLYFISGIGGALASVWYQYERFNFAGSVGASGAIYGLLGAIMLLVIVHKGRYQNITLPRLLFYLAYSVYSGYIATNVDNAGHIGGLVMGMILMLILYLTECATGNSKKRRAG